MVHGLALPLMFRNAHQALADRELASALRRMSAGLVPKRAEAVAALPEFEALSERAREIKDHTLLHLDHYLEVFERNCVAAGGQVPVRRGIAVNRKPTAKHIMKPWIWAME